MHKIFRLPFLVLIFLAAGCVPYHPEPLEEAQLLQQGQIKQDDQAEVATAVLNKRQSKKVFGVPLARQSIQPVWLKIQNRGKEPFFFLPRTLDPNYYSSEEVARRSRFRLIQKRNLVSTAVSIVLAPFYYPFVTYTNNQMQDDFYEKTFRQTVISPGETASGYVFTPLDKGTKEVPVSFFGQGGKKTFRFFIQVPDIRQDYKKSGFEERHAETEFTDLDLEGLKKNLEAQPCCTTDKKGKRMGDPLNLVIIGELQTILNAFTMAKWDETEALSRRSSWQTLVAFFKKDGAYRYSPVSPLYYSGRRHDVALQKIRDNINVRLHLRLWYTPFRYDGKPVWMGQVSRDIGVKMTSKTWYFMTHRIDPEVDESRDNVLGELMTAEAIERFGYVGGVGNVARSNPRTNLTNDPYFTDGSRLVLSVADDRTEPEILWSLPAGPQNPGPEV